MANTTGKKFGGRSKGTPNKDTAAIRNAFQLLIENNIDNLEGWLSKVAQSDPTKAFDILIKLSEYIIPKLSRSEVTDVTSLDEFMKMTPEERRTRIIELNNKLTEFDNGKFKKRTGSA